MERRLPAHEMGYHMTFAAQPVCDKVNISYLLSQNAHGYRALDTGQSSRHSLCEQVQPLPPSHKTARFKRTHSQTSLKNFQR